MNAKEILAELKSLENPAIKNVLLKHGAKEPFYGVKVEQLKIIQKRIKKDTSLGLELYDSGISDAMYLAGLITDGAEMTKQQLQHWVEKAPWQMISEYTVAWVTAESKYAVELALKWMKSKHELIASAGWNSLSGFISITPDEKLDLKLLSTLLKKVEKEIHHASNRVKYAMNGFIIAVGSYVKALNKEALKTAEKIGSVTVDMSGTSCKVPAAIMYIDKVKAKDNIGKKKKTVKC